RGCRCAGGASVARRSRIESPQCGVLQKHLFAPEPVLAVLNPGQEMTVTNWLWSIEQRRARMGEEARGQKTEDRNRQTSPDERGGNPSPLTPLPGGEGNSEFGAVSSSGLPSAKSGLGKSHSGTLTSAER